MDRNMTVILAANERYAAPLCVTLFSALKNISVPDGGEIIFRVFDSGIRSESKRRIEASLASLGKQHALLWHSVDRDMLRNLPTVESHPQETFLRLMLHQIVPDGTKRVVWLDCDTVVSGDLRDLFLVDLKGMAIAAVPDYGGPKVSWSAGTSTTFAALGISSECPYFNAGVMVIDLALWAHQSIPQKTLEYTSKYSRHLRYADQDGLNIAAAGRWAALPLRWNVQVATLEALEALIAGSEDYQLRDHWEKLKEQRPSLLASPFLIHFITGKPWKSGWRSRPARVWFECLRESAFFTPMEFWVFHRQARWAVLMRAISRRLFG